MSKLERWLTLVANLSVVVGIVFLAVQMRQNTEAIQAQTRDAMTEKEMMFSEWIGTNPEAAAVFGRGTSLGMSGLDGPDAQMFRFLAPGNLREWENSYYKYEQGLFADAECQARATTWESVMQINAGYRELWATNREQVAPSFRAEIDRIVAEVEQAQ
jgi:hypothetical protein